MSEAIATLIEAYPELSVCRGDVERATSGLIETFRSGGKLLLCGNGGSAADCEHIAGELLKGFLRRRPAPDDVRAALERAYGEEGRYVAERLQGGLPAISLVSQTALMTAVANDVAGDMVFAQQVYAYGRPGDALLAISTSGASANVIRAVQVASTLGLRTIALTGRDGGRLAALCDVAIRVPKDGTVAVQERHLPVYHAMCTALEEALFAS